MNIFSESVENLRKSRNIARVYKLPDRNTHTQKKDEMRKKGTSKEKQQQQQKTELKSNQIYMTVTLD